LDELELKYSFGKYKPLGEYNAMVLLIILLPFDCCVNTPLKPYGVVSIPVFSLNIELPLYSFVPVEFVLLWEISHNETLGSRASVGSGVTF
jgi:hypothetical protein